MSTSPFKVFSYLSVLCFLSFLVVFILPIQRKTELLIICLVLCVFFRFLGGSDPYTFRVAGDFVVAERTTGPSDIKLEIQNYQQLLKSAKKTGSDRIESSEFNAGGHSWMLVMYPEGNKNDYGRDHVSFYLRLVNIPTEGGAVLASFTFFIFDKKRETYITIINRRFDATHPEWGIARALHVDDFTDEANGLLINNSCAIGAEVYVLQNIPKIARLFLVEKTPDRTHTWRVYNYTKLRDDKYSPSFRIEGYSWKLHLYPKGNETGKNRYLSLYLCLQEPANLTRGWKLHVEYTLSIKGQISGKDHKKTAGFWFDSNNAQHGFDELLPLTELNSPNKGSGHDEILIIEANLKKMFTVQ
ncbi:hypothetical protein Ancab_040188 [Ancistrocladus abbreviatus]